MTKSLKSSQFKEDWEKEAQIFMDGLNIIDLEILNSIVFHKLEEYGLVVRKEMMEKMIGRVQQIYTCVGPTDEIHRCSYGHCENCGECDLLAEVLSQLSSKDNE